MAAELGFEPRHTESESAVLPLHNSAILYLVVFNALRQCCALHTEFATRDLRSKI